MSIDRSGWMMFLITATCITYRSWARRPIASTTIRSIHSVSDAYSATLKHLFTPTHAASRHLVGQMSTTEIFTQRKAFYQALYNQCSLENCKVIHIAGTKGKGSTVECISAGLLAAGKKVGVFTSPHLHTARERIKFNRDLITREEIIELGCQAIDKMQNVGWPPVFFDYFLTMALLYFGRRQPEYIVLECGLGGRYDSTNFCDHPLITVITSISLDHQAVLGNSIEEIAWQKAGIMKANVPIFTAETQAPSVLDVFRKEAKQCNAPFHVVSIDR